MSDGDIVTMTWIFQIMNQLISTFPHKTTSLGNMKLKAIKLIILQFLNYTSQLKKKKLSKIKNKHYLLEQKKQPIDGRWVIRKNLRQNYTSQMTLVRHLVTTGVISLIVKHMALGHLISKFFTVIFKCIYVLKQSSMLLRVVTESLMSV